MFKFAEKQLLVVDLGVLILTAILASFDNLLFHSFVEFICALTGIVVAAILLSPKSNLPRPPFFFLAILLLTVAVVDVLHVLTYNGMGIIKVEDMDVSLLLWIVSRSVFAFGFLIATFAKTQKYLLLWLLGIEIICGAAVALIFRDSALAAYAVGEQFKFLSEFIVIGVLVGVILRISFCQKYLSQTGHFYLLGAISLMALSEMMFIVYLDIFAVFNILGHVFKLFAYMVFLHLFMFHNQQEKS